MCLLCRVIFVVVDCCVPTGGVLFVLPFVVLALLCVTCASLRLFVCVCVLSWCRECVVFALGCVIVFAGVFCFVFHLLLALADALARVTRLRDVLRTTQHRNCLQARLEREEAEDSAELQLSSASEVNAWITHGDLDNFMFKDGQCRGTPAKFRQESHCPEELRAFCHVNR